MVLYHCNLGAVMSEARKAGEYLGLGRSLLEDLVEYYEGYPPTLWIPQQCQDKSLSRMQRDQDLITIMHTLDPSDPNKKLLLTSHLPERFLPRGDFIKIKDGGGNMVYSLPTALVYERHGAPCMEQGAEYREIYLNPTTRNTIRYGGYIKVGPYFLNSQDKDGRRTLCLVSGTTGQVTPEFLKKIKEEVLAQG